MNKEKAQNPMTKVNNQVLKKWRKENGMEGTSKFNNELPKP